MTKSQLRSLVNEINTSVDALPDIAPDRIFLSELAAASLDQYDLGEPEVYDGTWYWDECGLIQYESGRVALIGG